MISTGQAKHDPRIIEQVASLVGNYVYLLVDPITNEPFYVGKGSRRRMLDHGLEAEALTARMDEPGAEYSRKTLRIQSIRNQGFEPRIWILRYGMGNEYTAVEAAAIDVLMTFRLGPPQPAGPLELGGQLTNARREANSGHGIRTLDSLVAEFAAPELDRGLDPLLLITLKKWQDEPIDTPGGGARTGHGFKPAWFNYENLVAEMDQLADSVRCWWKISQARVERDQIHHVVAVHGGVTRALFEIVPGTWESDGARRGFQVKPILEGVLFDRVIGPYGHRTPRKQRGDQSTFNYWVPAANK